MVVGTIVGLVAKELVPGPDLGRYIVTIVLGMATASLDGSVYGVLAGSGAAVFDAWSVSVATSGAVLLLGLYSLFVRRTT